MPTPYLLQADFLQWAPPSAILIGIFIIMILIAAAWYMRQRRIVKAKNRVIIRQIKELMEYEERYRNAQAGGAESPSRPQTPAEAETPSEETKGTATPTPSPSEESLPEDAEALFTHLSDIIVGEQLYLDPSFTRQTLMTRYRLRKERIGEAFKTHTSLSAYVNNLRLDHAFRLLASTTLSIDEVAKQSGFSTRQTFTRNFVRRFGLTPTEFRVQQIRVQ